MADSTVDDLTAASALDGTEEFYAFQGAADCKVTGTQIKTLTSASPALVTPNLGTPTAGVLTSCTGLNAVGGGTGQSTYVKGDILASPGSNTLNKLAVGTDTFVLTADAASTNGMKWAAGGGGVTVDTTVITGGTTLRLLYDNAGTVGETAGVTFPGTGQLALAAGTTTTSKPVIDASQTWNDGGVTFTAHLTNITATASAADSMFADYQIAGTSAIKFLKPVTVSGGGIFITNGVDTLQLSANNQFYSQIAAANGLKLLGTNYISIGGQLAGTGFGSLVDQNGLNLDRRSIVFARHAATSSGSTQGTANFGIDIHQFDDNTGTLALFGQAAFPTATTFLTGGQLTITGGAGASSSAGLATGGHVTIEGGAGFGTGFNGSVILGTGAIATASTDGFVYIPTCAGTPSATPTTQTGRVALVYDTTAHKLWIYDTAWKGGTAPGVWS